MSGPPPATWIPELASWPRPSSTGSIPVRSVAAMAAARSGAGTRSLPTGLVPGVRPGRLAPGEHPMLTVVAEHSVASDGRAAMVGDRTFRGRPPTVVPPEPAAARNPMPTGAVPTHSPSPFED